jgi:hypothetical protein
MAGGVSDTVFDGIAVAFFQGRIVDGTVFVGCDGHGDGEADSSEGGCLRCMRRLGLRGRRE